MGERLVNYSKTLGWTAIGCLSIYIIFAFVFLIIFTGLGFIGGFIALFGGDEPSITIPQPQPGPQ